LIQSPAAPIIQFVDGDEDLHGAALAWVNAGEGQDGDGGLIGRRSMISVFLGGVEHFYHEELLALLLMAISEKLITMEAFVVLTPLCDLRR
jgi:hypothetical protein